ncbi:MAG: hypothetical protein IPO69_00485, partial [Saprospiraceae bacterium]|nr:hypothetical protein [Saprospiraceae bacterium]
GLEGAACLTPLAAIQGSFQVVATCLLVNKKNCLLQPRKAGGGLEGAACLRPHLPQYMAPSRAASCLLGNKKNYLLQPHKAGGGLEGAACRPHLPQYRAPFRAAFYLLVNRSDVGLFLGTSGAFQGRLLSLVNKKNYLPSREAGGGLEGAAC